MLRQSGQEVPGPRHSPQYLVLASILLPSVTLGEPGSASVPQRLFPSLRPHTDKVGRTRGLWTAGRVWDAGVEQVAQVR